MRNTRRNAFTLVELITVMAISAVLLTIIFVPMFQSFQATRTAQAYADAQDKARIVTERISKEIGEAAAVRDTDGVGGLVSVVIPNPARGVDDAGTVVTPAPGYTQVAMNYTKLDLILPARVGTRGPGGAFIDPDTGKEDPTARSPKGQVVLPLAAGTTMRRYWIGLRDPFRNYTNPYDGLLTARSGGRDNLFVLYMAEVEPVRMVAGVPQVNTDFFDPADATNRNPLFDDPDFFLATNAQLGTPVNNDAKAARILNWQKRATVVTEISRYDMLQPIFDRSSRLVKMNNVGGNFVPRINPLVQFRPTNVDNDGVNAETATAVGQEADGTANLGSEAFQTQYGMWSNATIRTYPGGWQPTNTYQIGRKDNGGDMMLYHVDPTSGIADTTVGYGVPLFNVTAYERASANRAIDPASRYPFSVAFTPTAAWMGSTPAAFNTFKPYGTSTSKGRVVASFGIGEIGDAAVTPSAFNAGDPNTANLPQVLAGTAVTPSTDPAVALGTFSDAPFFNAIWNRFEPNRVFNKVWADAQANRNGVPSQFGEVGGAHRFIDLRTVPQGDNTPSVLGLFPNVQIVPGSDEVFGPDQLPGPNFGFELRYRRVNREPGPNEYRINYTNQTEPTAAGYGAMGVAVPPANYDPTNFSSAIVQARFKVGYIQLCSNPETPIPDTMNVSNAGGGTTGVPGRIRVAYRFQFTGANDFFRIDYDTRQLMSVLVTIRNYPQSSVPNPQTVTMKATANVRNFLR